MQTAEAISGLVRRHKRNGVTIYAISPQIKADYLRQAGAKALPADLLQTSFGGGKLIS